MKSSSINNYHTTNYIMDKCIFQPQQLKVIIEQPTPPPTPEPGSPVKTGNGGKEEAKRMGEEREMKVEAAGEGAFGLTRPPPLIKKNSFQQEAQGFNSNPQSPGL